MNRRTWFWRYYNEQLRRRRIFCCFLLKAMVLKEENWIVHFIPQVILHAYTFFSRTCPWKDFFTSSQIEMIIWLVPTSHHQVKERRMEVKDEVGLDLKYVVGVLKIDKRTHEMNDRIHHGPKTIQSETHHLRLVSRNTTHHVQTNYYSFRGVLLSRCYFCIKLITPTYFTKSAHFLYSKKARTLFFLAVQKT